VQDPTEAEFPSCARRHCDGHCGLHPADPPDSERLTELVARKEPWRPVGPGRVESGSDAADPCACPGSDRARFQQIQAATILRRIARRMQVTRSDSPNAYYDVLRDNPDEAQALLGDLLISVTSFFPGQGSVPDARDFRSFRNCFRANCPIA